VPADEVGMGSVNITRLHAEQHDGDEHKDAWNGMSDVRNEVSHKFCGRNHRLLEEVNDNCIKSLSKGWEAPEGLLLTNM
jgi:hypothetical protein